MGWYITILQEMRDQLGLKGNELIVFAFINGYSQGGHGCYHGSLATLQEICGIASRQTAIDVLKSLVEKGLITKSENFQNGVKYVSYSVCPKFGQGVQKMDKGCPENGHNNKDINIKENRDINRKFIPPTIDEVRDYCQQRGNGIDPEEFIAHYTSNGWMVGKTRMKDWKSAIITWEKSRKKERKVPQKERKESVFEHNMRVHDELFGTNYHEQLYGKKEVCDEQ